MSVRDTAQVLWSKGFKPVLIAPRSKRPSVQGWQLLEYSAEEVAAIFGQESVGVGLRWGNGHVDVDLETPLAAQAGEMLLPATTMMWGRAGLDRAHRVYAVANHGYKTRKIKSHTGELVAELRHDASQSVVPPSYHPESGQDYFWANLPGPEARDNVEYAASGIPAVEIGELEVQVREVVLVATLAALWPNIAGSRHDTTLGLCGMLLKAGRSEARVREVVEALVVLGQDPDPNDRRAIPASTALRLAQGNDVGGFAFVADALGPEIAKWVSKMFMLPIERVDVAGGMMLNDMGNADLLCSLYGEDLRFLDFKQSWAGWDGKKWNLERGALLEQTYAKRTVEKMHRKVEDIEPGPERTAMRLHAIKSGAANALKAMTTVARDDLIGHEADFDKDMWAFNVSNGTLDLRSGELVPHRREDYITRMAPVEWDPKAEAPMWLEFLETIFDGDQDLMVFAQRMAGYAMTGNTQEQCLFFLYGHGKNGKTTFLEVLSGLYGDYALKTPTETVMRVKGASMIPNNVAALRGARLVTSKEVNQGARLDEGQVKDLTGGDTAVARFMHGEFFNFRPILKLMMYGNHKPTITGQDEGIWRRIRLVPFEVQVPEAKRVMDYHVQLLEREASGILRWCVEGCLGWQKGGLTLPKAVAKGTEEYRSEQDVMGSFILDSYTEDEKSKVAMENVYATYLGWCGATGEHAVNQRFLIQRLVERGYEKIQLREKWYFRGLREGGSASGLRLVGGSTVADA